MGTLYRAQILLEPEQHKRLAEIATFQGRSISDVVREAVQDYLSEQDQDLRRTRELAALEKLNEFRARIMARHGVLDSAFLDEAREEREQQLSFLWNEG